MRALVVTWGPGGNLPPLLAAAAVLAERPIPTPASPSSSRPSG